MQLSEKKQKWIMGGVLLLVLALVVLFLLGGGNLQLMKELFSLPQSS